MDAAALVDASSIAALKLDAAHWRQCFLQLRDAKDTFNAVVADSRVTNPEHLNLERLQEGTDAAVLIGRKYEIAAEELAMLRKVPAYLLSHSTTRIQLNLPAECVQ
jgi:hypothetical protein